MAHYAVVIAGGGPTGMMLAAELTLAGIDVGVVERRAGHEIESSRSGGLHSRTIEVLDQRGIADRFLAEGQAMQVQAFAGVPLDISDFPTRHNYGLALWQKHFERILAAWVGELGVPFHREREVTGFTPDETHELEHKVDQFYDTFLDRVSQGRASTLRCPTAGRSGRTTSSGATEHAA